MEGNNFTYQYSAQPEPQTPRKKEKKRGTG